MTRPPWSGWIWAAYPPLLAISAGIATAFTPVSENDLYLHALLGKDLIENGRNTGDPGWIYGNPANIETWENTTPANSLAYFLFDKFGVEGYAALHVLTVSFFVLAFAWALGKITARGVKTPGAARVAALVLTLITFGIVPYLGQRPQTLALFAMIPIAVWTVRIVTAGKLGPPRSGLLLVLLTWALTWFHGSSALIILVLFTAWAAWAFSRIFAPRRIKENLAPALLAWIVLAALATLATPAGIRTWTRSLDLVESLDGFVDEWSPPTLTTVTLWAVIALLALWAWGIWGILRKTHQVSPSMVSEALLLAALLTAGAGQARILLLVTPIIALLAARRASLTVQTAQRTRNQEDWPPTWETWRPMNPMPLVFFVLAAIFLIASYAAAAATWHPQRTPQGIWTEISQEPGQRKLLVGYEFGAQALYFTPQNKIKVSADPRLDLYSIADLNLQARILNGYPNWEALLTEHYPDTTDILAKRDSPLVQKVEGTEWTVSATGGDFVLLTREGIGTQ